MKYVLVVCCFILYVPAFSQTDDGGREDIIKFQKEINEEYKNPKTSPLESKARKHFKGHSFFTIDLKYRVMATLKSTEPSPFFKMKTSSMVLKEYRVYGVLEFILDGKQFKIPVYQSQQLMSTEKYKDYLFLPFTDLTNGEQTYSAGRYIDLQIPTEGDTLIIDFNKAYNPYCAYSTRYSCPIVPAENHLDVEILAGVTYTPKK